MKVSQRAPERFAVVAFEGEWIHPGWPAGPGTKPTSAYPCRDGQVDA